MSHKLTAQIVRYCDILQFSLLRGSGLKFSRASCPSLVCTQFSLLRGSGLKLSLDLPSIYRPTFSLLRGSGLKYKTSVKDSPLLLFSLLRGSGLKCDLGKQEYSGQGVLPLAREWIEITGFSINSKLLIRSPSCEGVD